MNKVVLVGRLTRDPELRYTGNNTPVASFTLAVNRPFTTQSGEREADFINIVVWRKQAENVKNYLTQGSQAAVEGRIQTRSYDGEDGKKRYITEVVADNVEFLSSNRNTNTNGQNSVSSNQGFGQSSVQSGPTPYDFGSEVESRGTNIDSNPFADFGASIEISDDELPF